MNLSAAFQKKVDPDTYTAYYQRLVNWHLYDHQWARATSAIISEEESFPKLSQIYSYLKAVRTPEEKRRNPGPAFQMFTIDGLRYARRINLNAIPPAPENATDIDLAIPEDLKAREPEPERVRR